ncbi:hypothetical protein LCGC14_1609670 [marine sediment metagenome]|uniref:Uracil-DNA glycosylase-like domain-containing protein n=1 Tax=marine sediment metagenome TaxID=412755 RepID=A0A0F9KPJ4_9ZZZZ
MLKVIQPDGKYCGNCVQQPVGRRFVPADGSGSNKVLLLGDSPWTNEIASGKNFAGAAGYTSTGCLGGQVMIGLTSLLPTACGVS